MIAEKRAGRWEFELVEAQVADKYARIDLLNDRYAANRVTDITGNETPAELAVQFDARIARRLDELCTDYPMLL